MKSNEIRKISVESQSFHVSFLEIFEQRAWCNGYGSLCWKCGVATPDPGPTETPGAEAKGA